MELVSVVAAFCAATKTDEKKPLELFTDWLPDGVRDPVFLPSSIVGVSGVDIIFDNLLGGCVAGPESDLTRRCEIMFPEGDVIVTPFPPFVAAGTAFFGGELGLFGSVGVGGVTVVSGAKEALAGGVCGGAVAIVGKELLLALA